LINSIEFFFPIVRGFELFIFARGFKCCARRFESTFC